MTDPKASWCRRRSTLTGCRVRAAVVMLGLAAFAHGVSVLPVAAQESWNPFNDLAPPSPGLRRAQRPAGDARPPLGPLDDARSGAQPLPPDTSVGPGVFAPREAVDRSDLPSLTPGEGPGPGSTAAGGSAVDPAVLAKLSAEIQVPTASIALSRLLVRLIGPRGLVETPSIEGLGSRSALLYRAGRVRDADRVATEAASREPVSGHTGAALNALRARLGLAVGDRERACSAAQALVQAGAELPAALAAEGIVIQGYCGAAGGNATAAGLAASLGREQGGVSPVVLAALEAAGAGESVELGAGGQRVGIIEWRLAETVGKIHPAALPLNRFEPAALVAVAQSNVAAPSQRVLAVEAAARINAVEPSVLAEVYRQQSFSAADLAQGPSAKTEAWARRAFLFKAAEAERTPSKRTRLVRAALDDARRAGIYVQTAAAFERIVEEVKPVAEVGWFAETAVEVMLAAGRIEDARRWAQFGAEPRVTADRPQASLSHWVALIDIGDPAMRGGRGASLASVEELALRGRFTPEGLHRLATVLDALDYNVPVRLWEAASRAPQPTSGHLPATGVLSELQEAARRKDLVRTVSLVFKTLGVDGPEGAHMIALGDTIRALKRAGLEQDARAVATEALFALWPRAQSS